MSILIKAGITALTGAVVATVAMVGLVYSQTHAPSKNPASEQIITYGDK